MTTKRDAFVRQAANLLVDGIYHQTIALADCTIDAIYRSLDPNAPWVERLSMTCQYDVKTLSDGQRRALAKSIAGYVANHPGRAK